MSLLGARYICFLPLARLPPADANNTTSGDWGRDVGIGTTFGADNFILVEVLGIEGVTAHVGGVPDRSVSVVRVLGIGVPTRIVNSIDPELIHVGMGEGKGGKRR